jgi:hypothetical protein
VKTLLRGQAGSGPEMLASRAALSNFVLLNPAVVQAELSAAEAGLENTWRVGPAPLDSGHASYLENWSCRARQGACGLSVRASCVVQGMEPMCFSLDPPQPHRWGWLGSRCEIPLGEEFESYHLEFLDGAL